MRSEGGRPAVAGLPERVAGRPAGRAPRRAAILAGLLVGMLPAAARAQYPPANVPDLQERSGLLMRFTGVRGQLPPDPLRDNFYNTRYADRGLVKHQDGIKDQGLYGLGWKARHTASVYPYFMGSSGTGTVDASSRPWPRPFRFFQTVANPYRPVGMYYSMGSYVPIYDFDAIAPGPGPYPFPFYFNWFKGG
ncbi:hypothetical protein OJF2_10270 [Aquisphaera giovannonii]|uniref:Uncharacterized protein n=1 Tax=Aquisphaera giovannonii TaxID=406548 RepID=A0A5B9VY56_9BACT|nr:hypothetical protein [Aquisphaera giovannonii]QEH32550.1 hypothetical protein OJF2_10270 [Aquisphaera giovannonii]